MPAGSLLSSGGVQCPLLAPWAGLGWLGGLLSGDGGHLQGPQQLISLMPQPRFLCQSSLQGDWELRPPPLSPRHCALPTPQQVASGPASPCATLIKVVKSLVSASRALTGLQVVVLLGTQDPLCTLQGGLLGSWTGRGEAAPLARCTGSLGAEDWRCGGPASGHRGPPQGCPFPAGACVFRVPRGAGRALGFQMLVSCPASREGAGSPWFCGLQALGQRGRVGVSTTMQPFDVPGQTGALGGSSSRQDL